MDVERSGVIYINDGSENVTRDVFLVAVDREDSFSVGFAEIQHTDDSVEYQVPAC